MNSGEFGVQYVLGTSFNMVANTGLALVFTRPDGTVLTVTNPAVTINAAVYTPTTTPNLGTFAGNTYFLYTFANGDVNQSGLWSVRGHYLASGVLLLSNPSTFTVNP